MASRTCLGGAGTVTGSKHLLPLGARRVSSTADCSFGAAPGRLLIVHGQPVASEALREPVQRELGWHAAVPLLNQRIDL
jgi:hypothetical protein